MRRFPETLAIVGLGVAVGLSGHAHPHVEADAPAAPRGVSVTITSSSSHATAHDAVRVEIDPHPPYLGVSAVFPPSAFCREGVRFGTREVGTRIGTQLRGKG